MLGRPTMRTVGRTAVSLFTASLLFAGCTATASVSDSEVAERLSADEFARRGNAICAELSTTLEEIAADNTDDSGFVTPAGGREMAVARADSFARLFALRPPIELQPDLIELEAIRTEWDADTLERIPEPDRNLRLGGEWAATTERLNLSRCE